MTGKKTILVLILIAGAAALYFWSERGKAQAAGCRTARCRQRSR